MILDKVLANRIILPGDDSRLKTRVGAREGGKIVSQGQKGCLVHGPYIPLEAGKYQVVFHCTLGERGLSNAHFDVVIDKGRVVIAKSAFEEPDKDSCFVVQPILLNESCSDIEIRVWVTENTDLQISMIEIVPLKDKLVIVNADSDEISTNNEIQNAVSIEPACQQQETQGILNLFSAMESKEDAQVLNDTSVSGAMPTVPPVIQNPFKPSRKERSLLKAKRKKKKR